MMKKIIGLKVKNLREQQKISQENLAFNLEISQSYLSKIEKRVYRKNRLYSNSKNNSFFSNRFTIFFERKK